jgi:transposase
LASERSVGRPGPLSRRGSKEAFTISSGVPAVAFNHEMKEHWMSVIIGIDPHKSTHTAVAVDRDEQPVARLMLPARAGQTERLLAWAEPLDADRVWAIESAAGLGRLLAQQLIAAGERVIDVPPTLSARVRLLSGSRAGKNDTNDALSTAIAGMRHCGLRVVRPDDQLVVLRLLADRHHDLTGLRTQAACRLHVMFRELIPGGARLRVSAAHARRLLDGIEPVDAVSIERHRLAHEHLADIERIDAEIDAVKQRIAAQVAATGTAITELHGVGPVIAAIVLGQVGDISRFRTRAQFANYNGTDRSVEREQEPASRQHPRQPCPEPRDPHDRGHPSRPRHARARVLLAQAGRGQEPQRSTPFVEATSVRRGLATAATRPLKLVGPGRQTGATLESSAAGLNPDPGTSDKSAPDPN